jgi:SAM-dependent methyltransferase
VLNSNSGMKEGQAESSRVWPFDAMAADYDAWFEEIGRTIFDIEVQAFRGVLPLLPKPWLEVGVGSGRFAQALGIELGLDPSIKVAEMARRRGITVLLGTAEEMPFTNDTFGTLFVIVTICFVASPIDVLRESHRVLVPGGKLVLGLVLRDSPFGRCYEEKKKRGHRFYKHATFYSYAEVSDLLKRTGFSTERIISTLFQRPGEVEHMESPRDGFASDAGFTIIVAGKSQ